MSMSPKVAGSPETTVFYYHDVVRFHALPASPPPRKSQESLVPAEVIAIGDELTSGQQVDTNSAWISQQLGDLGIRTLFHTTVADDWESMASAFRVAMGRVDLIVITGGLGPTADDVTRDVMAAAVGVPLVRDEASLATIRDRFQHRGREMPPRNERQAWFPAGSSPIPNPNGTAPGIDLIVARESNSSSLHSFPVRMFALPGVPAEMKEMWQATVMPALITMATQFGVTKTTHHRCLRCFGVGESDLEQMLPNLMERGRDPSVGITVSRATITLRVTTTGSSREECLHRMEPTIATIRDRLGDLVFGEEDDRLEDVVLRLLKRQKRTLVTYEWETGGRLAHWLEAARRRDCESMDGPSPFWGGLVLSGPPLSTSTTVSAPISTPQTSTRPSGGVETYSIDSLESLQAVLVKAVSDSQSDVGLAIGPVWKADGTSIPTVGIAWVDRDVVDGETVRYTGHPDILADRLAKQGLDCLRRHLGKLVCHA